MSFEFEASEYQLPPLVGDEMVDALRNLQTRVDSMTDYVGAKRDYYERATQALPIDEHLGRYRRIDTERFVAVSPDLPLVEERIVASRGIEVIGRLDLPRYLQDEEVPIDDMTVTILEPQVVEIEEEQGLLTEFKGGSIFRLAQLYIPVLAIRSCVRAA